MYVVNLFTCVTAVQIASGTALGGGKSLVFASKTLKPQ